MRVSFALLWAAMLHLTLALLWFGAAPHLQEGQGRAGPGAGIEIRLGPATSSLPAPAPLSAASAATAAARIEAPAPVKLTPGGSGGDAYLAMVRGRLAAQSARTRFCGRVLVEFGIGARGEVERALVAQASPSPQLDREALALVQRAAPFPSPPRALRLTAPIEFGKAGSACR